MDDSISYCPYCGFQLPSGSSFCPKCGKEIQTAKIESKIAYKQSAKGKTAIKLLWVFVAIVVLFPVVLMVVPYILSLFQ